MKKILVLVFVGLLFVGCKNSNIINESYNIENVLPNGIILSDEKVDELYNFCKNFDLNNDMRSLISEEYEIDEEYEKKFIEELTKKYGEEAKNYYGTEIVKIDEKIIPCFYDEETNTSKILETDSNARYAFDSIDPNYYIVTRSSWTKHWSLTWTYYSISVSLCVENYYFDEAFDLKTDKAYYVYKDSVTNKSGWEDWTKFDNPEKYYPYGDSKAAIKEQIDWAVAEANRGCFEVSGKKKKGWLPKVKNQEMTVVWYDDFINGGSEEILYTLD